MWCFIYWKKMCVFTFQKSLSFCQINFLLYLEDKYEKKDTKWLLPGGKIPNQHSSIAHWCLLQRKEDVYLLILFLSKISWDS